MIKKILLMSFSLTVIIAFSACGITTSPTQTYISAFEKTENAETMQVQTKTILTLDLSNASDEARNNLEAFKEIKLNTDEWIDRKNKKTETRLFLQAGDIMGEASLYEDGDLAYLKSSFLGGKYIKLNEFANDFDTQPYMNEEFIDFYEDIFIIWKNSVQNEILENEGNSIENTPDGDIKVKIVSLELNDESIKSILAKFAKELSENKEIIDIFAKMNSKIVDSMISAGVEGMDESISKEEISNEVKLFYTNLPEKLDKVSDKFRVNKLKLTARIDKDSYIISQKLEGSITIMTEGEIVINFEQEIKRWDIDSGEVKVDIPQISDEDLFDIEEFNDSKAMKDMFEKFIK